MEYLPPNVYRSKVSDMVQEINASKSVERRSESGDDFMVKLRNEALKRLDMQHVENVSAMSTPSKSVVQRGSESFSESIV